jgi:hypothetical protein
MMLPKPYEIEYPVLTVKYGAINLAVEAEPRLDEIFGNNFHCLNTNFMEKYGLGPLRHRLGPGRRSRSQDQALFR